jgi:hypothetical protein
MKPQDRAIKKQLLLMKGEVLRVKLSLELEQLRKHPLGMAGEGFKAFTEGGRLGNILSTLAGVLPSEALRRWLRRGTRLMLLWKLASKFWPSR